MIFTVIAINICINCRFKKIYNTNKSIVYQQAYALQWGLNSLVTTKTAVTEMARKSNNTQKYGPIGFFKVKQALG